MVAGAEVAGGIDATAQRGATRIARGHTGRPHQQLADAAGVDVIALCTHDPDVHPREGPSGGAELLGMFPGVGCGPSHDLPHLGLPVAVEHRDAEPFHEAPRRQG